MHRSDAEAGGHPPFLKKIIFLLLLGSFLYNHKYVLSKLRRVSLFWRIYFQTAVSERRLNSYLILVLE